MANWIDVAKQKYTSYSQFLTGTGAKDTVNETKKVFDATLSGTKILLENAKEKIQTTTQQIDTAVKDVQ